MLFGGRTLPFRFHRPRFVRPHPPAKTIHNEEGLVHVTYNIENGQIFICNCCTCCCGLLRSVKEFNAPYLLAKSHFTAAIDRESCSACGVCADERCPMNAIVEEDGEYAVLNERCIGCGVCVSSCPTESIKLERKPESEHDKPPANLMDWNLKRAAEHRIGHGVTSGSYPFRGASHCAFPVWLSSSVPRIFPFVIYILDDSRRFRQRLGILLSQNLCSCVNSCAIIWGEFSSVAFHHIDEEGRFLP